MGPYGVRGFVSYPGYVVYIYTSMFEGIIDSIVPLLIVFAGWSIYRFYIRLQALGCKELTFVTLWRSGWVRRICK